MKKIIIAVLALLSTGVAEAQFEVAHSAPITYVVYPMKAGVSLKYTKIGEEAEYFLQLNTTNQFDGAMLIYLGNRDKARASLSQLLNELYGVTEENKNRHGLKELKQRLKRGLPKK